MKVDVRVEVLAVKLVHGLGVLRTDVALADVLADDGAVPGFDQAVVAGMMRPRTSWFDEQIAEQARNGVAAMLVRTRPRRLRELVSANGCAAISRTARNGAPRLTARL